MTDLSVAREPNRPIAPSSPVVDSSLDVDPAIVNDFLDRHHMKFDSMTGDNLRERQAVLRYLAEIDFRRYALDPKSPGEVLEEELLDSMTYRLAWELYRAPDVVTIDPVRGTAVSRTLTDAQEREQRHYFGKLCDGDLTGLRLAIAGEEVHRSVQEVPALRIVPVPWRPETIRKMMGSQKDDMPTALASTGQAIIQLYKIDELDVYLVASGNHRILGHQWAGEETIEAEVSTRRLELNDVRINNNILSYRSSSDGTWENGPHSLMSRADRLVAKALDIPEVGRSLG